MSQFIQDSYEACSQAFATLASIVEAEGQHNDKFSREIYTDPHKSFAAWAKEYEAVRQGEGPMDHGMEDAESTKGRVVLLLQQLKGMLDKANIYLTKQTLANENNKQASRSHDHADSPGSEEVREETEDIDDIQRKMSSILEELRNLTQAYHLTESSQSQEHSV
ncbi:MAG: hypothetical protein Q9222_004472 [Ikaeria aurantiellina]